MKISIFGMGYVGCVTAACLAKMGNQIYCVEVVPEKIDKISHGKWPVFERGLDDLCERDKGGRYKNIVICQNAEQAISECEISIVCVGTPNWPNGQVDLSYLRKTSEEIASAIHSCNREQILFIRSTIPPGTTENVVGSILKEVGVENKCHLAFYPEFLREGSALDDFFNPSLSIIGCGEGFPVDIVREGFPSGSKGLIITSIKAAEAIKYACNAFHGLKIAFANEFAFYCKACGAPADEVMKIFCEDTVLNISHRYLRPGFAFGGSCLPKDIEGAIAHARENGLDMPLFKGILKSNESVMKNLFSLIFDLNVSKIGFFGVTFKPDTDDIRESPVLKVIEKLLSKTPTYQKPFEIHMFDRAVAIAKLNNLYDKQIIIEESEQNLIRYSELIVLGPYKIVLGSEKALIDSGKPVINLKWHAMSPELQQYHNYYSLC